VFSWIISSSLKFRFLVLAVAAALLVFGTEELRRMPVDVFPEFAPPKVEVQTEGMGMTSSEVEELITIPMEDALRGTPGIDVIRSASVVGLSQVVMLFAGHRPDGCARSAFRSGSSLRSPNCRSPPVCRRSCSRCRRPAG
jgi:Cu/Ag efflux pump CusA